MMTKITKRREKTVDRAKTESILLKSWKLTLSIQLVRDVACIAHVLYFLVQLLPSLVFRSFYSQHTFYVGRRFDGRHDNRIVASSSVQEVIGSIGILVGTTQLNCTVLSPMTPASIIGLLIGSDLIRNCNYELSFWSFSKGLMRSSTGRADCRLFSLSQS